jgi:NAD+ diphosphatase
MYTPDDFATGYRKSIEDGPDALWFVVHDGKLLVTESDEPALPDAPMAMALRDAGEAHWFGTLGGRPCIALNVEKPFEAPAGYRWSGLRQLFLKLPDAMLGIAGRALQIVEWDRSHRFCGRCGTPTQQRDNERVKVCPACGFSAYPRVAPAMMVLVHRGDELLLARAPHYAPGMYSALAGFVEAGESIEDTIHREVREEVGLEVKSLRYFGSQSWPFPHQLMVAFHAEYAGGELRPDPAEIADAKWFTLDALPKFPSSVSISSRLIASAIAELRARKL